MTKKFNNRFLRFTAFVTIFIVSFVILSRKVKDNPIVGDGYENVTIAVGIVQKCSFSLDSKGVPQYKIPTMKREPLWPMIAALCIKAGGLDKFDVETLCVEKYIFFKYINIAFLTLSICMIFLFGLNYFKSKILSSIVIFALGILLLYTTPRLINFFNNEPLSIFLVILSSFYLLKSFEGRTRQILIFGVLFGLLILTKAQFLMITPIVVLAIFVKTRSFKKALIIVSTVLIVIAPWLIRNKLIFGKPAIASRGNTVFAARICTVVEHEPGEVKYMFYAFTHPKLRPYIEKITAVKESDFDEGGYGQRFNREHGFDMASEIVRSTQFKGDILARSSGDYKSAIQLRVKGAVIGENIEQGKFKFLDYFHINAENIFRYTYLLPLYFWRGLCFSSFPVIALLLMLSQFLIVMTKLRGIVIISLSSHVFHLMFTHNIVRYHIVEFGIMLFCFVYFLDNLIDYLRNNLFLGKKHQNSFISKGMN